MDFSAFQFPTTGSGNLSNFKTDFLKGYNDPDDAKDDLEKGVKQLADLQEKLYAQDQYSLLVIFQAMDAAGKDSTIKHVMSGINPQGCSVTSFKSPSTEELDHNFLWRCMKETPAKGDIGIFNRSYYEEVLVVRVHPEWLGSQKLPVSFPSGKPDNLFWQQRYDDINHFEKHLYHNGTRILKFFLNVSKAEQKERFLKRIDSQEKNWKFSINDIKERKYWNDYQLAYNEMLRHTSTDFAPWYIIPADRKLFMQLAVCNIIVEELKSLHLHFPVVGEQQKADLQKAKDLLLAEED